ncbi:MAG: GxxExxY protein [Chloroflexi bacterium]|nr:GxxExxY protein [Chloroflexota bacterium]
MALEYKKNGSLATQQKLITIYYDSSVVGEYYADFVVEDKIIIEVKAIKILDQLHTAQCLTYTRATKHPLALLINFGTPKAQIKRIAGGFD